jgi:3',5'-cyclic AMP phosphodiesterase CpdA
LPGDPSGPVTAGGSGTATLSAVGDIGWCGSPGVGQTARLVEALPGDILLAGDNAYMHGSAEDYRRCFDPEWGRLKPRLHPTPGNHEAEDGLNGYFGYFGAAAGPGRRGYYSFRAATWHVLMLNSNDDMRRESAQWRWIRSELQQNPTRCTLAVWHHPFASSGPNGLSGRVRDVWQLLNEFGAEIVVSGHDHFYERFAPQTEDYRYDAHGIRQFVAGTGGAPLYRPASRGPNTEAVVEAFGALRLALNPSSYSWEFIEASTGRAIDQGSASCH